MSSVGYDNYAALNRIPPAASFGGVDELIADKPLAFGTLLGLSSAYAVSLMEPEVPSGFFLLGALGGCAGVVVAQGLAKRNITVVSTLAGLAGGCCGSALAHYLEGWQVVLIALFSGGMLDFFDYVPLPAVNILMPNYEI